MEWYYVLDDERKGPVSEEELKKLIDSGIINNESLVWNERMDDWEKYCNINKKVPPRIPQKKKHVESSHKKTYIDNDLEERMYGMLCHASVFTGILIPFSNLLIPLAIWLFKRNQYELVDYCGKESLNFQISFSIYFLIAFGLLALIKNGFMFFVVLFLILVLAIISLYSIIKAAILSYNKEFYSYPLSISFLNKDYNNIGILKDKISGQLKKYFNFKSFFLIFFILVILFHILSMI